MASTNPVQREWLRRVEAEYRSAAFTQHLGLWLIQIAAPPALIESALTIVGDEMAHAALSNDVYRAAGGVHAPQLGRETLALKRSSAPLEHDVLRHGVQLYALGETVAVRLFERMRRGCTEPSARTALDRILRDEVRHREFGWTLLEWMLETPLESELRALLASELGPMLEAVRASYAGTASSSSLEVVGPHATEASNDDRAWGLVPLSEYVEAVDETFARDYRPRFEALDVIVV